MIKRITMLTALMNCCFSTTAQVHQHGQGQLFVSQENSDWHVQFILPAADVLGFEHAPENAQQEKILHSLIQRLDKNDAVVDLGEHCTLSEVTHSLSEHSLSDDHESGGNKDLHEDKRYNDHHAHEEHSSSENHHADNHDEDLLADEELSAGKGPSAGKKPSDRLKHAEHQDVEVEYHFACDTSHKKLSVPLFQWLPSLGRIQAQWITDAGQGTAVLNPENPNLEW
ncbi:conserved hypothetical protein [Paraglaciecola sp. T6c]|uniref:ZrgA family zinc uptake protein n=1 Tax=Pseudoalteromonas atlantica (strain T6c / ATCC BAA-1087) TaxID=3042615 RepID=UPI00005C6120|nr:DUF2796 domain-containing protein [Paraglaciecola sp. T6c]ABG38828.1 conserved hypothetical protein [Paraglaciecola sp. T6c]